MKIGITAGAFDLCHAGHILMFKEAKTKCDHLIVCLQEDPSVTQRGYRGKKKAKPIMSLEERLEILRGIRYIDEVIIYRTEDDWLRILEQEDWDIRIIGADWKGKQFTGWYLDKGEIYYNKRDHNYSTTELRKRIKNS